MVQVHAALIAAFFSSFSSFTLVSAFPVERSIRHERRSSIPSTFKATGPAPAGHPLTLSINLAAGNISGLETALMAAADPSSPTYGQWLSKSQVEAYMQPSAATLAAVDAWMTSHNATYKNATPAGDWITTTVPVSQAAQMLDADYNMYVHRPSGNEYVRTMAYSIPLSLAGHIAAVHPTTSFNGPTRGPPVLALANSSLSLATSTAADTTAPVPNAGSNATTVPRAIPAGCKQIITPACLQALYGIPATPSTKSVTANASNVIGVTGMDGQFANSADLQTFLTALRPDMSPTTGFNVSSIDNGVNTQSPQTAGIEANLDIQYTVGVATNMPIEFITVGQQTQDGPDEGFLDTINALLARENPPQVLTTSYGLETESALSPSLTNSLCNTYMQLTARGVSILFASGDGGVASTPGVKCTTFAPTFPTCPLTHLLLSVTLVGATQGVPETGAALSAGGFSNYFPTAPWQTTAVQTYLTGLGQTNAGLFNRTGRAYPDISAQGKNIEIVIAGQGTTVDGTSASSPIVASVIGMLNQELINAGKPVMGFLNPWLYKNPQAFNDVTSGNNPGCGSQGFPASQGWDPVTGLGTPDFQKMRTALGLA